MTRKIFRRGRIVPPIRRKFVGTVETHTLVSLASTGNSAPGTADIIKDLVERAWAGPSAISTSSRDILSALPEKFAGSTTGSITHSPDVAISSASGTFASAPGSHSPAAVPVAHAGALTSAPGTHAQAGVLTAPGGSSAVPVGSHEESVLPLALAGSTTVSPATRTISAVPQTSAGAKADPVISKEDLRVSFASGGLIVSSVFAHYLTAAEQSQGGPGASLIYAFQLLGEERANAAGYVTPPGSHEITILEKTFGGAQAGPSILVESPAAPRGEGAVGSTSVTDHSLTSAEQTHAGLSVTASGFRDLSGSLVTGSAGSGAGLLVHFGSVISTADTASESPVLISVPVELISRADASAFALGVKLLDLDVVMSTSSDAAGSGSAEISESVTVLTMALTAVGTTPVVFSILDERTQASASSGTSLSGSQDALIAPSGSGSGVSLPLTEPMSQLVPQAVVGVSSRPDSVIKLDVGTVADGALASLVVLSHLVLGETDASAAGELIAEYVIDSSYLVEALATTGAHADPKISHGAHSEPEVLLSGSTVSSASVLIPLDSLASTGLISHQVISAVYDHASRADGALFGLVHVFQGEIPPGTQTILVTVARQEVSSAVKASAHSGSSGAIVSTSGGQDVSIGTSRTEVT